MLEQLTDKQLTEQLAKALESSPLYRELIYTGAPTLTMVPQHLTLFCPNCLKDQFWETDLFRGSSYAGRRTTGKGSHRRPTNAGTAAIVR